MKKISWLFLTIVFINIFATTHKVYSYKETVRDSSAITYYEVVKTDSLIKRIYKIGNERQTSFYTPEHLTTKFFYKDANSNYSVTKEADLLITSGTKDGEKIYEEFELDDDSPWWQSMSYSLSKFVNSRQQEVKFQVFIIGKLDVMQMRAKKEEVETVTANGSKYSAWKVAISPTGFWGNFWSAHYWFRSSDGLFLKYEGANGPPGTPTTVIEFIERVK